MRSRRERYEVIQKLAGHKKKKMDKKGGKSIVERKVRV